MQVSGQIPSLYVSPIGQYHAALPIQDVSPGSVVYQIAFICWGFLMRLYEYPKPLVKCLQLGSVLYPHSLNIGMEVGKIGCQARGSVPNRIYGKENDLDLVLLAWQFGIGLRYDIHYAGANVRTKSVTEENYLDLVLQESRIEGTVQQINTYDSRNFQRRIQMESSVGRCPGTGVQGNRRQAAADKENQEPNGTGLA